MERRDAGRGNCQAGLELIERKEEVSFEEKNYYLYALDLERVMDPEQNLISQGILPGEPFVLI